MKKITGRQGQKQKRLPVGLLKQQGYDVLEAKLLYKSRRD